MSIMRSYSWLNSEPSNTLSLSLTDCMWLCDYLGCTGFDKKKKKKKSKKAKAAASSMSPSSVSGWHRYYPPHTVIFDCKATYPRSYYCVGRFTCAVRICRRPPQNVQPIGMRKSCHHHCGNASKNPTIIIGWTVGWSDTLIGSPIDT